MIEIDVDLARRLVATQFPEWAHLPVRPVEESGWDNRTFRLGEHMSVRMPSAEAYSPQVEKEHRWLPKLAPLLPLPIPVPLKMGVPAHGYPWHWSVYRWRKGEGAACQRISDPHQFAMRLAEFLNTLQRIDPEGGPVPGPHNFFRGGDLSVYDAETQLSLASLDGKIEAQLVSAVWATALESQWQHPPVWVHGDVSAGNLLVQGGTLSAVIDFSCLAIGDPACDLTIAWTLFSGNSRKAFQASLQLDKATWSRARGWALWKALLRLAKHIDSNPTEADKARQVIEQILTDHKDNCQAFGLFRGSQ